MLKVPTYIYIIEIVSVCDCTDFTIVASLLQSSFQTVLLHQLVVSRRSAEYLSILWRQWNSSGDHKKVSRVLGRDDHCNMVYIRYVGTD